MDNRDIDEALERLGAGDAVQREIDGPGARWIFQVGDYPVLIQTQESVNRMRIVAFIAMIDDERCPPLVDLMEANYHSALDVRYALTDGQIVSAFLHPLRELTPDQFDEALEQVLCCATTLGTTNSSGELIFGEPDDT